MDTDQLNIRISKSLLFDLEFIARASGIQKNEWIRYHIAKMIKQEKESILEKLEFDFVNERINEEDLKAITGNQPSEQLQAKRQIHSKKLYELLQGTKYKKYATQALHDMNKKQIKTG